MVRTTDRESIKVISLLGLPGSGKSYYGKKLAAKMKVKFLAEIATQLIITRGFTPGKAGSVEFDRTIFNKNLSTAQNVLQRSQMLIWEGGPVQDRIFLERRLAFGGTNEDREAIVNCYEAEVFKALKKRTLYIFFDVPPQTSLLRQKQREKPFLSTTDFLFLKYIYTRLVEFTERNPRQTISIQVDKSKNAVFNELYNKVNNYLIMLNS
jgi:shikimate kinase